MKNEPCAKFTIRVTPKMMERPEDTRNSVEAYDTRSGTARVLATDPASGTRTGLAASDQAAPLLHRRGRAARFTKALSGWKSLPSA